MNLKPSSFYSYKPLSTVKLSENTKKFVVKDSYYKKIMYAFSNIITFNVNMKGKIQINEYENLYS